MCQLTENTVIFYLPCSIIFDVDITSFLIYNTGSYIICDVTKIKILYKRRNCAMKRKRVNRRRDRRAFSRTVNNTKTINVKPKVMRGGIRL